VSAAAPIHEPGSVPPIGDVNLVRVYVWQWPVRLAHWLIACSILVLSLTGLYIGRPFLISAGEARHLFLMGTAKAIHFYAAIVFIAAILMRLIWMFTGNTYARWDKFIPAPKRRREGIFPTVRFYLFGLRKPPGFVGHNPLAGMAYTLVFGLYFIMIATGLALYDVDAAVHSPVRVFSFLLPLFGGAQSARWIHHVVMWLLWGFVAHHIYSAVLMSQIEGNGTMESIFSGYKFVQHDDVMYSGYRFFPK